MGGNSGKEGENQGLFFKGNMTLYEVFMAIIFSRLSLSGKTIKSGYSKRQSGRYLYTFYFTHAIYLICVRRFASVRLSKKRASLLLHRLFFLFITLVAFCFSSVYSFAESSQPPLGDSPNFVQFMTGDESVGEIRTILQDQLGFVWLGGKNGLVRYDGYRAHIYRNSSLDPRSLSNNNIADIHETKEGVLWFASEGGGVMRLDRSVDKFDIFREDLVSENGQSSNGIFKIFQDSEERIWLGTYRGLNRYNPERDLFEHVMKGSKLDDFPILDIEQISENEYLYGTLGGGVFKWNRKTNVLIQYEYSKNQENGLPHGIVMAVYKDSRDQIWIGTNVGLSRFNPETGFFHKENLSDGLVGRDTVGVTEVYEGSDGTLWLATDGAGLLYRHPDTGNIGSYRKSTAANNSMNSSVVRTVIEDNNRDIWVGVFPRGVNFFDRSNNYVQTYRDFAFDPSGVAVNNVWQFAEDRKGNVWVGTNGAGLVYFDRENNSLSKKINGVDINELIGLEAVLSVYIDSHDELWVGSWNQGAARVNLETLEVHRYMPDSDDPNSLVSENVWDIREDSNNNLWISNSEGGLNRYNREQDNFFVYRHSAQDRTTISNINAWSTYQDSAGRLWVGTNAGFNQYHYDLDNFTQYLHDPDDPTTIGNSWVTSFYEDTQGRFWISTGGAGVAQFEEGNGVVKTIRAADGLANDTVFGIIEDDFGFLWFSTRGGLSRYNPTDGEIKNFNSSNWFQGDQFNIGSYLKLKSGELMFGGTNGFSIFKPEDVTYNEFIPPVYITEMQVFNKVVNPEMEDSPVTTDIINAKEVVLEKTQSVFSFRFTALNYRTHEANQYMYRLKGFEKNWNGPSNTNDVTYTNLDAGKYVFQVKASNSNGLWNPEIKELPVIIKPHLWLTWWAYIIYAAMIAGLVFWYVYTSRKIIEYQQMTMDHLKEVDHLKDEFVASTSHELRTPLFGIIGLAETLLSKIEQKINEEEKNNLKMIVVSGKRLVTQVNDILDFSKIRDNSLEINQRALNLYDLCELSLGLTRALIDNHDIELRNEIPKDLPAVFADDHRLQQVIINLISNAIKFTQKGYITISARRRGPHDILIAVKDTGRGIPKEKFDDLFQEFTQIEDLDTREKGGTGLGLSITKRLVELQGGKIWLESKVGEGSTFFFTVPKTEERAEESTLSQQAVLAINDGAVRAEEKGHVNEIHEQSVLDEDAEFKILVVDDEAVNRMVIKAYFNDEKYKVVEAACGRSALEYLENETVDLIILDVMMPEVSGYDVCEAVRKHYSFHELPILLSSARNRSKDIIKGYNLGANGYLKKPMEQAEFVETVKLHLKLLNAYRKQVEAL